jgi:glycerol-3-phosphate dehydrogenase
LGGARRTSLPPAGASDGIGLGDIEGSLNHRSLAELLRLGTAMGGMHAPLWLERAGDLIATCFSRLS